MQPDGEGVRQERDGDMVIINDVSHVSHRGMPDRGRRFAEPGIEALGHDDRRTKGFGGTPRPSEVALESDLAR